MPGLRLFSLKDFPKVSAPLENGKTFEDNALIKAKYYSDKFKINTISDDGGLEIDVLNGEPGVKSRRWIDGVHESTDEELIEFCLKKLKGKKNRKAKLTACICLYMYLPDGNRDKKHSDTTSKQNPFFVKESVCGVITKEPSKIRFAGFPFRSLLWIPALKKYYAENELTEEETKKYNHRYKAIQRIKNYLINDL